MFRVHGKNLHTLIRSKSGLSTKILIVPNGKIDSTGPRPPCPNSADPKTADRRWGATRALTTGPRPNPQHRFPALPGATGRDEFFFENSSRSRPEPGAPQCRVSCSAPGDMLLRRAQRDEDSLTQAAGLDGQTVSVERASYVHGASWSDGIRSHLLSRSATIVCSMKCLAGVTLRCSPAGYPRSGRAQNRA